MLHADGADTAEVLDGLFDVFLDDAVVFGDADSFAGEDCGLESGRDAGCYLHCAADLGAVADHSCDVADHVLDGCTDLLIVTAAEIDKSARSSC